MERLSDYQKAQKWLESIDWDDCPESDDNLATICEALQYKDLEEQGKLLKLPCKLGDATFWISDEDEDGNKALTVMEGNPIIGIAVQEDGLYILSDGDNEYQKVGGRWAFLTKEAAEAALKEMSE